jgi:hypothetical protein
LKKKVEEDTKRQKDLPCSLINRINIVEIVTLPKAFYRINEIPTKFQYYFSQK